MTKYMSSGEQLLRRQFAGQSASKIKELLRQIYVNTFRCSSAVFFYSNNHNENWKDKRKLREQILPTITLFPSKKDFNSRFVILVS